MIGHIKSDAAAVLAGGPNAWGPPSIASASEEVMHIAMPIAAVSAHTTAHFAARDPRLRRRYVRAFWAGARVSEVSPAIAARASAPAPRRAAPSFNNVTSPPHPRTHRGALPGTLLPSAATLRGRNVGGERGE